MSVEPVNEKRESVTRSTAAHSAAMRRITVPVSDLQPEESQRGKWRWRETKPGQWWMCYWNGGAQIECYGPFVKPS